MRLWVDVSTINRVAVLLVRAALYTVVIIIGASVVRHGTDFLHDVAHGQAGVVHRTANAR